MIRLNDIESTRVNEKDINYYKSVKETMTPTIKMVICGDINGLYYSSKELRDKDIELLDKLLEVKSIEDKANAYPHEIDALKFAIAMSDIKKEFAPVKEEYITWDYVKQFECGVNTYLPEGSVCKVYYEEGNDRIQLGVGRGYIYDEDLFNALMLKKVE
jgi:exonuclease III